MGLPQESVFWNGEAVGRGDKYVVVKLGRVSAPCFLLQSGIESIVVKEVHNRPVYTTASNKKGVRKVL